MFADESSFVATTHSQGPNVKGQRCAIALGPRPSAHLNTVQIEQQA